MSGSISPCGPFDPYVAYLTSQTREDRQFAELGDLLGSAPADTRKPPSGGEQVWACRRVADGNQSVHTPTMNLKNAALLALIGTLLLTILLVAGLVFDFLNLMRGLIPATKMLSSLIHSFAALTVTVFFYTFHERQS